MFQTNIVVLSAFALYLLAMLSIGVYYSRSQQRLSDYILGGRSLGPWITSMSAEASDMSGWMLMGLPGFAYAIGISAFWTAFGLCLGTFLNWHFVSRRLRNYTEVANNSLTNVTSNDFRLLELKVGISYSADLKKAKAILERLLLEEPRILTEEEHVVFVNDLGDSAVILGLRAQVKTENYWPTRWKLLEEIKLTFDAEGIEIPYPQMDIHMR